MPTIKYYQDINLFATPLRKELHQYFMRIRRKFIETGREDLLEELEFIQYERRIQCPESFITFA